MKLASAHLRDVMIHYHEEGIRGTWPPNFPPDPGTAQRRKKQSIQNKKKAIDK
jgi:hypothetical protein